LFLFWSRFFFFFAKILWYNTKNDFAIA